MDIKYKSVFFFIIITLKVAAENTVCYSCYSRLYSAAVKHLQ